MSRSRSQPESIEEIVSATIKEKLDGLPSKIPNKCIFGCQYRCGYPNVHTYSPSLLSIGPYQSGSKYMEEVKLCYLNQLIKRVGRVGGGLSMSVQLKRYLEALTEMEDQVQGYYQQQYSFQQYDLLETLLLDGCFIIELFRYQWLGIDKESIPLLDVAWTNQSIRRDLLLLENQLPFFVLEKLYDMTRSDNESPLFLIFLAVAYLPGRSAVLPFCQAVRDKNMAMQSISDLGQLNALSTNYGYCESKPLDPEKLKDIKHLLDLAYKFMIMEEKLVILDERNPPRKQENEGMVLNMKFQYRATDLRDVGVTFVGVETGKFYDIRFEYERLEIPVLKIGDDTETILQNLVAYEQYRQDNSDANYFTDYVIFMSMLLKSAEDVELLCGRGIIENGSGHDGKEIAAMFSNMSSFLLTSARFYYADIINKLDHHCSKAVIPRVLEVW